MTGNTFGNTTEASARYSYRILASFSSVVLRTSVACSKHGTFLPYQYATQHSTKNKYKPEFVTMYQGTDKKNSSY